MSLSYKNFKHLFYIKEFDQNNDPWIMHKLKIARFLLKLWLKNNA